MSASYIEALFTDTLANILTELTFSAAWTNNTGYLDNAVSGDTAPTLEEGQVAKSIDPHNRRIIFIGVKGGNVVIFDRYKREVGDSGANTELVAQYPTNKIINSLF